MSARMDPIRALERSPYFKGLPVQTLHALSMFADERAFRAGESVLTRGTNPDAILVLYTGELAAEGANGDVLGPGALVGHLDLIAGQPLRVSFVARGPGLALSFGAEGVLRLMEDRGVTGSAFRRAIIMSLSDQLRGANQAIAAYVAANPQAAKPSRGFLSELSGLLSGTRAPEARKK